MSDKPMTHREAMQEDIGEATARLSARPFRDLCPEVDMRDAMTDDEFWAHVYPSPEPEYDETTEPLDIAIAQDVCGECGSLGACAWDSEGRPLIHATNYDNEADQ